jgi:hypothetical protein
MNSLSEEISGFRLELTVDQSNLANPKGLGLKVRGLGDRLLENLIVRSCPFGKNCGLMYAHVHAPVVQDRVETAGTLLLPPEGSPGNTTLVIAQPSLVCRPGRL